jgi:hypothetical protein
MSSRMTFKSLKSTVFKYRKSNNTHKFLMEGEIVAAEMKFLRTLHSLRIS